MTKRPTERGFALLAIFLMAAVIALMLYVQLPRVAFESEREKEQLLIDRGEQFVRAIYLFTRDYRRFPATLKELEETNNKRYLRRLYVDPYTGKDEWRLIHSNGSQLTDSLVEKPPLADGTTQSSSTTTTQDQPEQVNDAVRQRSSDQTLPGNDTFFRSLDQARTQQAAIQQQFPNGAPIPPQGGVQVGNPQLAPGTPGGAQQLIPLFPGQVPNQGKAPAGQTPQFQPQFPGQQFPGQQFPGQAPPPGVQIQPFPNQQAPNQGKAVPGQPGQAPQFQPQFPGQQFIGQQFAGQPPPPGFQIGPNGQLIPVAPGTPGGIPGFGVQQFPNQMPGQGVPGAPGQQTQNNPGPNGLPPSNPGASAIVNDLLRGPNAARPPAPSAFGAVNSAAAGIAGVASTHTGPTIKVYKERKKYEEWEFVYTPTTPLTGQTGGSNNPQNPNDPNRPNPNNPNSNNPSPFGNNPSPFGNNPSPFGGNPSPFGGNAPNPGGGKQIAIPLGGAPAGRGR